MGLRHVLVAFLTALAIVLAAWLARSGLWRRGRLALVAVAVVAALGLLARRLGLGELAVVAVLVVIPFLLVPARRAGAAAVDRR
jgi:hypothetical protein